ncbi:uncharacterized protein LOC125663137 isoform X3 [Ostrea edulis]|uniref:uncharacterized protein LOC125663137 isoform X3 n=1 Tax=Ostrea edulis TaxID=37623 RepID=UPI0024AF9A13|nr:uncharacterized protein LOC125663137 isoform X3 [Ostrea edulis]
MQMKQVCISGCDREKKKVELKVKVLTYVNMIDVQSSEAPYFQFFSEGLAVWKAYSIGRGILLPWSQVGRINKTIEIQTVSDWSIDHDTMNKTCQQILEYFSAPRTAACVCMSSCQKTVVANILIRKCDSENLDISDGAKRVYAKKLEDLYPKRELKECMPKNWRICTLSGNILSQYLFQKMN